MRSNPWVTLRNVVGACVCLCLVSESAYPQDPLPSWTEGKTKTEIIEFVQRVSDPDNKHFVPVAERIATFDNDGTLWPEQPIYTQVAFALDLAVAMPADDPNRKLLPPLRTLLTTPTRELGGKLFVALVSATHGGEIDEFHATVENWIQTKRHPRFDRPYPELAYYPMLELFGYLRKNDFQVWIVSGGDIEFMRVWAPKAYGVPPERIIGSTLKTKYVERDGKMVVVRSAEFGTFNIDVEKPISIQRIIGRRPIAAFGNSDGDLRMLQWVTDGKGLRLAALVHHTDATREWAYDRKSAFGRLDKALDQATAQGWTVVDMKRDWNVIFAWEKPTADVIRP